jgi:enterochelin esterase-like enzyme
MALVGLMAAAAVLPGVAKTPSVQAIVNGEVVHLRSAALGEDRTIDVYLPSSYETSRKLYPVVYALDGGGIGPVTASTSWFLSGYVTLPRMPEVLVVAVRNTDRNRDMPVPEAYGRGGEERFLKFLADELAPFIDARYRTQLLRILLGHSQGGTFAHYALATRPRVFPWILALDAPLFRDAHAIAEKIRTSVAADSEFHGRLVSPIELEIAFVRLVDDHTLQWGIRNGKGPGVVVHNAHLVHGALEGKTEDFGFPQDGPPGRHFHFERGPVTEG